LPFLTALLLTYLTLVITAILSGTLLIREEGLSLPFLLDFNVNFLFLVSFPLLLRWLVTDDKVLAQALYRTVKQGAISFNKIQRDNLQNLLDRWYIRYGVINLVTQLVGVFIGAGIAYWNYIVYTKPGMGYWITSDDHLNYSGWVYLTSIGLFYFTVFVYIARIFAHTGLLTELVKKVNSTVTILHFHPDRCGGLHPIGEIGLRNQVPLSVIGVNFILLYVVSYGFLQVSDGLLGLIVLALMVYILMSPLIFFGPLMPFRREMIKSKHRIIDRVVSYSSKLKMIENELELGHVTETEQDKALIARLRYIGDQLESLPIWPFDPATIRAFIRAYLWPLACGLITVLVDIWLTHLS
jgi:hypothetical protein